jgi:hypothetical protein
MSDIDSLNKEFEAKKQRLESNAAYEALKESVNANAGTLAGVKKATDVITPLVQAGTFAGAPGLFTGLVLGPVLPALSAAFGFASTGGKAMKLGLGKPDSSDNDTAAGYRAAFKEAAQGCVIKQGASSLLMTLSSAAYFTGIGGFPNSLDGAGIAVALVTSSCAAVLGWKAHKDAERMSVYEAALKNERKMTPPAPQV